MRLAEEYRDPWVVGGLALLALLSFGTLRLYRSAPQSVGEARSEAVLAARPNAFAVRRARAEELLRAASEARATGRDSVAHAAYAEAVEHGWRARELGETEAEREAATGAWGSAMLGWAELLLEEGRGVGLRPDDDAVLREALARVEAALSVPLAPALRARGETLRAAVERQLRVGPLELLPSSP